MNCQDRVWVLVVVCHTAKARGLSFSERVHAAVSRDAQLVFRVVCRPFAATGNVVVLRIIIHSLCLTSFLVSAPQIVGVGKCDLPAGASAVYRPVAFIGTCPPTSDWAALPCTIVRTPC